MWKNIKGFNGLYQINEIGEVKSTEKQKGFVFKKETILKQKTNQGGYKSVGLSKNNKRYDRLVHRLVAIAFIKNPLKKPQINHKDGNRTNNRVDNLEWVTCSENIKDIFLKGRRIMTGENHNNTKLNWKKVNKIRKSKKTGAELAKIYNVSRPMISKILHNETWKI